MITSVAGNSKQQSLAIEIFLGAAQDNCVLAAHREFAIQEVADLIWHGHLVPHADIKWLSAPPAPRLVQLLSAKLTIPRLIYDAKPIEHILLIHLGHHGQR